VFPVLDLLGTQLRAFPRRQRLLASEIRPRRQEGFGDRPPIESMNFSVTITEAGRSARVRVTGDLDYETADEVVEAATQLLARQVDLIDLHLDFSALTFLDSAALSGLLLLQRRATQSGVQLHLDHRPAFLDRVLQVTGLHDHFAASHSDAAASERTLAGQTSSSESSVR
jgi:anti-anti-sigma factor